MDDDTLEVLRRLRDEGVIVNLGDDDDDEDGMSLDEAIEMLSKIAELEQDKLHDPAIRGQWSRVMGNYTMVGDTTPELPPGYYDLAANNGQLFFIPIARRYDKILRFPHAAIDVVLREIEEFWSREDIFRKWGLPYKRGILLYGPPGSGKTSALQLVARDVVKRGGIVLMFDHDLFLTAYRQVRRVQPTVPIVVIMEDLDAILESRVESSVLNLLDGAEALHKVVFLATTNYPEKLGPRIINRPSRFDKRILVGHPDDVGRRMYIESLIDGHEGDLPDGFDIERYVRDTRGMSLAHLKELFVATVLIGQPYKDALQHLRTMHLSKPTSAEDGTWDDTGGSYI